MSKTLTALLLFTSLLGTALAQTPPALTLFAFPRFYGAKAEWTETHELSRGSEPARKLLELNVRRRVDQTCFEEFSLGPTALPVVSFAHIHPHD